MFMQPSLRAVIRQEATGVYSSRSLAEVSNRNLADPRLPARLHYLKVNAEVEKTTGSSLSDFVTGNLRMWHHHVFSINSLSSSSFTAR